jgi:hypothetical protein
VLEAGFSVWLLRDVVKQHGIFHLYILTAGIFPEETCWVRDVKSRNGRFSFFVLSF